MYPKEKVDVESLRQLLPEEIPLLSIKVLPPLPGDPLPASLGGLKPPPSGLSDLRSDAHSSSINRVPILGASHFSWRGPACLGGNNPLGTDVFVF